MESINKTPYTPGPWRFDKVTYGQDLTYHIQTVDMSHRNTFIGEVGGGLQFNSEITANARLVSKAPELLEKLDQFITLSENNSITYKELEEARKLIFRIKNG